MKQTACIVSVTFVSLFWAAVAYAQSPLTMQNRFASQRAQDEVNWNHTVWAQRAAKPELAAVLPASVTQTRIEDALRQSNALARLWSRPITGEQLQAEMQRIARQTKQPEVLRELWSALDNDPGLIAEVEARPLLAERLVRVWYAEDERFHGALKARARSETARYSTVAGMKRMSGEYLEMEFVRDDSGSRTKAGVIGMPSAEWDDLMGWVAGTFGVAPDAPAIARPSALREDDQRFYVAAILSRGDGRLRLAVEQWRKIPFESWWAEVREQFEPMVQPTGFAYELPQIGTAACANDCWSYLSFLPTARSGQAGVWTGTDLVIWGGVLFLPEGGGRYNPATDSWHPISNASAPSSRNGHTVVWTGTEMIVWGGWGGSFTDNLFNTGGRYNPLTDAWRATSVVNAPSARRAATAVWTGGEMIVWGGLNAATILNTGGRYNPSTDSWTATSLSSAPAPRTSHAAIWSGAEMIVWGGFNSTELNSGGRYNPATDSWRATGTVNAPAPRSGFSAVWTGTEMVVWAGANSGGFNLLNSGGRYSPAVDSWQPTSVTNAPAPRFSHAAVWTGSEMIVFGGCMNHDCSSRTGDGARYNPSADTWTATSLTNAPSARNSMTAVWTGTEMLIWGGCISGECQYTTNTGARYNPSTNSWVATAAPAVPFPRTEFVSVWTGTEMLIWGIDSQLLDKTVYRYAPATDNWSRTINFSAPDARSGFSGVWTGSELIVWGGGVTGFGLSVTGGRFNPITNTWTPTSTTNTPTARWQHSAVWTGSEMIVWGGCLDWACTMMFDTGGRYDPKTDSWSATGSTGVPSGRYIHSALWTGSEMLVWGGNNGIGALNSGGRFNPVTNSWNAISLNGAPGGRWAHAGVWTGSEMLVWGGYNGTNAFDNGARYQPANDTWTGITLTGAPRARWDFPAVWSGSDLIVWGGILNTVWPWIATNTGGRYNPSTGVWTSTTTQGAPSARDLQQAVWTGSQMIVWSGVIDPGTFRTNSGGAYAATSAGGSPTPLPTLMSLILNPTSLISGSTSQGTVTLSNSAPVGGAVVTLASSNGAASVPGSVTVVEGAISASFTVTANPVPSATTVTIAAAYNNSNVSATLNVGAAPPPPPPPLPAPSSLTLSPASVKGGSPAIGVVTLSGPAPAAGAVVSLASSDTSVAVVPVNVTVAAGAVSASFGVTTKHVPKPRAVTVSASYGGTGVAAMLTVTK